MTVTTEHGHLMDDVYRHQRLIYDLTRKYYLLGRDDLLAGMDVRPDQRVLEIACGTGRNLAALHRRYPSARLYGLDISEQMLTSARAKLGARANLMLGDAAGFSGEALFRTPTFDHVILSYSLSMIPDWQGAIDRAVSHLAPGGQLHIVDFGDCARLPDWFRRGLFAWLARFHVQPRLELPTVLGTVARTRLTYRAQYRGYAIEARLIRH